MASEQKNPFSFKRFPLRVTPGNRELIEAIRRVNKRLEDKFGHLGYHGILLAGSRALGYGRQSSDIDYMVVLNEKKSRGCSSEIIDEVEGELKKNGFEPHCLQGWYVDQIKDSIASGQPHGYLSRPVSDLFLVSAGKTINKVRMEILEEIMKRPDSKEVWREIQKQYSASVIEPFAVSASSQKPPRYSSNIEIQLLLNKEVERTARLREAIKSHSPRGGIKGVLRARRRMALPSLSKTHQWLLENGGQR